MSLNITSTLFSRFQLVREASPLICKVFQCRNTLSKDINNIDVAGINDYIRWSIFPHSCPYCMYKEIYTVIDSRHYFNYLKCVCKFKADFLSLHKSLAYSLRIFVDNFSLLSPLMRVLAAWLKIFN